MADEELDAIRRQRMAELQAKHGVSEIKQCLRASMLDVSDHIWKSTF